MASRYTHSSRERQKGLAAKLSAAAGEVMVDAGGDQALVDVPAGLMRPASIRTSTKSTPE